MNNVKQKIEANNCSTARQIRLTFAGQKVEDDKFLSDYNIGESNAASAGYISGRSNYLNSDTVNASSQFGAPP